MTTHTPDAIARAARFHQSKVRALLLRKQCGLPIDESLVGISRHLQLLQERKLEQFYGLALTPDGDLVQIPSGVAA